MMWVTLVFSRYCSYRPPCNLINLLSSSDDGSVKKGLIKLFKKCNILTQRNLEHPIITKLSKMYFFFNVNNDSKKCINEKIGFKRSFKKSWNLRKIMNINNKTIISFLFFQIASKIVSEKSCYRKQQKDKNFLSIFVLKMVHLRFLKQWTAFCNWMQGNCGEASQNQC